MKASSFHLFQQRPATLWENISRGGQRGHFWYAGENPATIELTSSKARAEFRNKAMITYYVGKESEEPLELAISDLNGREKRVVQLDSKPGVHRYLWDLEFEAKPYTEAEIQAIEEMFQIYLAESSSSARRRNYNAFKNAKTPLEKRRIVESAAEHYSGPVEDTWLVPKASPGAYRLTLRRGKESQTGALVIREDPLLEGK